MGVAAESELVDVELELERQRDKLLRQLRAQRERGLYHYAWYLGEQDPPALRADYRGAALERLRKMSRGAWARLVVDTLVERLELQGVLSSAGDLSEQTAWTLLQRNQIDSDQRHVHSEAMVVGLSYVSVGESQEAGFARIAPETSLEVTHVSAPGDRRTLAAALKVANLGDGVWSCELYRPELTAVWTAHYRDSDRSPLEAGAAPSWEEPAVNRNSFGVVPIVPFENRATAAIQSESELKELEPIMERIQELELAKLVAAHTAVFRQKWATGLVIPKDDNGQPIESYVASLKRLWYTETPDTKFGSFEATEIRQYLAAVDAEVAELAAVSRVPSHYLVQRQLANPPSAESLIASESGLVAKVKERQRTYGESWEEVVRLAATFAGVDELAGDHGLELIWREPERRNPAVMADAAVKLGAVGVPQEAIWSFLGYSPQAIERMRVLQAEEQLAAAAAQAAAAASLAASTPAGTAPPSG